MASKKLLSPAHHKPIRPAAVTQAGQERSDEVPSATMTRYTGLGSTQLSPKEILQLQRTIGNQAVIRLLKRAPAHTIQRKIGFEVEIANPYSRVKRTSYFGVTDEKPTKGLVPIKGDSILVGYGWDMTPDGGDKDWKKWWIEFISHAVDETTAPEALAHYAEDLVKYIKAAVQRGKNELIGNTVYKRQDYRDYSTYLDPNNLYGQFQVTGGVRLDQLMTLLQTIIKRGFIQEWNDAPLMTAKEIGEKSSKDPNYNNFVALLGTYISGQYDKENGAPASAKHNVPVLSKTRLGQVLKSLGYAPDFNQLVLDVLQTSGIEGLKPDSPLFPFGITGKTHRGIDQNPNLTIENWLSSIYKGADVEWSDTEYPMEDVGKAKENKQRAKGLVVEIRSFTDKDMRGMHYEEWPKFAQAISDIFKLVNESKSKK